MKEQAYDELPWDNTEEWEWDTWYPMAVGSMWIDCDKTFHEGYHIFKKECENGDITPVVVGHFTFRQALEICEAHNGKQLIKRKTDWTWPERT